MTKLIKNIILATSLLALAACSDETAPSVAASGNEDAICLSAGVLNAPSAVESRAPLAGHYALKASTAINLCVEGDWAGKTPSRIVKTPVYTVANDANADNINDISPKSDADKLFWDDYGTADVANVAGREKGLDIYAVAIDGETTAPAVADWNVPVAWVVKTDGNEVLRKDILVANNLSGDGTPLHRFTFDEQKTIATNPEEGRLDFKHVLSKVTFKLKAGAGFSGGKFAAAPVVTLTRNKATGTSFTEYCFTEGSVDIKNATATGSVVNTVTLQPTGIADLGNVVEQALIFPGSDFGAADSDIVARIDADGNVYYVTAEQIRAAITAKGGHDGAKTLAGCNYIFQVTVNKTDIVITATITDWTDVTAETVEPKIVVSAEVGAEDDKTKKLPSFRFYRNADGAAEQGKYIALADAENPEADDLADGSTTWNFKTIGATPADTYLYWPDHTRHYFFRGVYPCDAVVTEGAGSSSYIVVGNEPYNATAFPCNLMIGKPELSAGTMCDNPDHAAVDMSTGGICARTGAINLNFRYMMSQVEVVLKTVEGDDKVKLDANTKLSVLNLMPNGNINLGERKPVGTPYMREAETELVQKTAVPNVTFHYAMVPQYLPTPSDANPMQFKVTITNDNGTTDVYYTNVQPIKVDDGSGLKTITQWLGGYHYKYTLNIKKTGITVTATITDWVVATGSDDIWL